jgi:hypothetical protein
MGQHPSRQVQIRFQTEGLINPKIVIFEGVVSLIMIRLYGVLAPLRVPTSAGR